MKTEKEIRAKIKELEPLPAAALPGNRSSDLAKAMEQTAAESKLTALYWTLGEKFTSKLKGKA